MLPQGHEEWSSLVRDPLWTRRGSGLEMQNRIRTCQAALVVVHRHWQPCCKEYGWHLRVVTLPTTAENLTLAKYFAWKVGESKQRDTFWPSSGCLSISYAWTLRLQLQLGLNTSERCHARNWCDSGSLWVMSVTCPCSVGADPLLRKLASLPGYLDKIAVLLRNPWMW